MRQALERWANDLTADAKPRVASELPYRELAGHQGSNPTAPTLRQA